MQRFACFTLMVAVASGCGYPDEFALADTARSGPADAASPEAAAYDAALADAGAPDADVAEAAPDADAGAPDADVAEAAPDADAGAPDADVAEAQAQETSAGDVALPLDASPDQPGGLADAVDAPDVDAVRGDSPPPVERQDVAPEATASDAAVDDRPDVAAACGAASCEACLALPGCGWCGETLRCQRSTGVSCNEGWRAVGILLCGE